jgi:hypothetical protein
VSNEPEYLQRLRRSQQSHAAKQDPAKGATATGPALSPTEHEAVRWAKEVAKGTELRSIRNVAGSRFAALLRLQSASGVKFLSLEGFANRDALVERVKPGATVGEEVLGAFEVRGGRPVDVSIDEAQQVVLKIGAPRPGANPLSPEQMIRRAQAEAVEREKTRPKGGGRDKGRR